MRRSGVWLALFIALLAGCGAHVHHIVRENETLYSISFRYGQDFRDVARWNGLEEPYAIRPGQPLRIIPPQRESRLVASGAAVSTAGDARGVDGPGDGGRQMASSTWEPAGAATGRAETIALDAPAPVVAIPDRPQPVPAPTAPPPSTTVTPGAPVRQEPARQAVSPQASVAAPVTAPAPRPAGTAGTGTPAWSWPVSGVGTRADLTVKPSRRGLEIAAARGEPVRAAAAGRVVYGGSGIPHYGNLLIIKHNDRYLSAYAHNDRLLVNEGQEVAAGQQIAEMGSSGVGAGGVRLHFEIREDGEPVDPMRFLPVR